MAIPTYPYQYQYPQPPVPSPDGRRWVQGDVGALSYMVTDNTVVTLWDSTDPDIFYEKSTDANGRPILKKYRRTEIPLNSSGETTTEKSITAKDIEALEKRISRLERRRRPRDEQYERYDHEDS